MITVRPSEERGHADLGWLETYHTFSFGNYQDPNFLNWSHLRVLNQDRVAPSQGFGTHGHEDMEIVSYVLSGVLEHKDSMGNGSQMRHGEVQLMSAGSGVTHSEFNASESDALHFLQMWVMPAEHGTRPRYEQKLFSENERRGKLRLVVSPEGVDGSLTIGQDARLYIGLLYGADSVAHRLSAGRTAWLHVATGTLNANGTRLGPGDGAAIGQVECLVLDDADNAEFVLWDLPEA